MSMHTDRGKRNQGHEISQNVIEINLARGASERDAYPHAYSHNVAPHVEVDRVAGHERTDGPRTESAVLVVQKV